MHTEVLQKIGLSKNEARVYETLLSEGETVVGQISKVSGVHRRNVYDSIHKLIEKGLVYEITHKNERNYQAVDPKKLMDLVNEEEGVLETILPELGKLYESEPSTYEVQAYRGGEDFKKYMRDILRVNESVYHIGVMGSWLDERWSDYFPKFIRQLKKQNISISALFEYKVKTSGSKIVDYFDNNYKFIPAEYETPSGITVFGDYVHIFTELVLDGLPKDTTWIVIKNKKVADSFRTWFKLMWQILPNNR